MIKGGLMDKRKQLNHLILITAFLLCIASYSNASDELTQQAPVSQNDLASKSNKATANVDTELEAPKENKTEAESKKIPAKKSTTSPINQAKIVPVKKNKNDRFTPTEAISEDLAVSFPTDI